MNIYEYENEKKKEKYIECDACNFSWKVEDTVFKNSKYKTKDGDILFVQTFECKCCKKEYIVLVDSVVTLKEKQELDNKRLILKKEARICSSNLSLEKLERFEKLYENYKSKLKDLDSACSNLKNEYVFGLRENSLVKL